MPEYLLRSDRLFARRVVAHRARGLADDEIMLRMRDAVMLAGLPAWWLRELVMIPTEQLARDADTAAHAPPLTPALGEDATDEEIRADIEWWSGDGWVDGTDRPGALPQRQGQVTR
jgi:hypothetical protein